MCVIEGLMARKEPKSPKVRGSGSGAGDLLEHQRQCGLCGDDGLKALKSRYGASKRVAKSSPVGQQPDSAQDKTVAIRCAAFSHRDSQSPNIVDVHSSDHQSHIVPCNSIHLFINSVLESPY